MLWGRLDATSPPFLSLLKSHASCIKLYHSCTCCLYHQSGLLYLSLLRPLVLLIVTVSLSLSLSLSHHPSSPQPLMFEPAPSDFRSKKLGNHILMFHCPLRECDTSLLKALELTARSLLTLPSHIWLPQWGGFLFRLLPCFSLWLWSSVLRTLGNPCTWQVVLDGTLVEPPPHQKTHKSFSSPSNTLTTSSFLLIPGFSRWHELPSSPPSHRFP